MNTPRIRLLAIWGVLLLLGVLLLAWSLQGIPLADLGRVFSALQPWQILVLLVMNIAILLLFPLRWSRILRAQRHPVAFLALVQYRLVAFAVSYFTPGQHFGGEPLQVLYLKKRHKVPGSAGLASVTLDKVIELFANFAVLVIGLAILFANGSLVKLPLAEALPLSLLLLLVPSLYLLAVTKQRQPISALTKHFSAKFSQGIREAERQLGALAREKPVLLWQGLLIAALVWAMQIFEFWLALLFLGLRVNALELTLVVVAGRLALLAPTPGALGALEASQVLAMQSLGYDPTYGLSLALLIRARDIFFGLAGLLLGVFNRG